MKAIAIESEQLLWQDHPEPSPGPGEVVIDIHATAINRADLVQRSGGYPPPPGASPILGLECAGVVSEVDSAVSSFAVGDRVCALLSGGGYAERVAVPAGQVLPIPAGLDYEQAAALPEVFATAYLNLFMEAGLQPGESALLHAGASGVGTAGIQLCKAFHNPCYVTAGSAEKIAQCVELGALAGADRHGESFSDLIPKWTDGRGVDVILDPVGAGYLADNLAGLALDGRLVIIGLMGGAVTEVNLGLMMMKRLRIIGSTLRARPIAGKARVMDALRARVWPKIEAGEIKPIIEKAFPMSDVETAYELVASNQTVGKVVLNVR
ncbi:MAG: NAD(P)H-quinone oxidoreductase [Pseudomonadaceae bacterium]|nr:NAD(P)H-quinone oxidoreductase [Pseudomonadaceae bacterium]